MSLTVDLSMSYSLAMLLKLAPPVIFFNIVNFYSIDKVTRFCFLQPYPQLFNLAKNTFIAGR